MYAFASVLLLTGAAMALRRAASLSHRSASHPRILACRSAQLPPVRAPGVRDSPAQSCLSTTARFKQSPDAAATSARCRRRPAQLSASESERARERARTRAPGCQPPALALTRCAVHFCWLQKQREKLQTPHGRSGVLPRARSAAFFLNQSALSPSHSLARFFAALGCLGVSESDSV